MLTTEKHLHHLANRERETVRQRLLRIAKIRDKKCDSTDYINDDGTLCGNLVGLWGEYAFEQRYGLPIDESKRPYGDGGKDFIVDCDGQPLTIDVKAANTPRYLFVQTKQMPRCADIVVLAKFHLHPYDENKDRAELIGWERRAVIAASTPEPFGPKRIVNYFVESERLLLIPELDKLLEGCTDEQGNFIRPITTSR
jgi:hypothetical protein